MWDRNCTGQVTVELSNGVLERAQWTAGGSRRAHHFGEFRSCPGVLGIDLENQFATRIGDVGKFRYDLRGCLLYTSPSPRDRG